VPGLADGRFYSFESVNCSGHYLGSRGARVALEPPPGDPSFKAETTFRLVPGLANVSWSSFELFDRPGFFLRHREAHLFVETYGDPTFREDATFNLVGPKWRE